MRGELLQLAAELTRRREPFVLAVVVRREPFSSAQPGDMAVITSGGVYHGWIGGACAAPSVRREAERVLADGEPRLLSLGPDPSVQARPGVIALPITCHSGGTVEIFLEPVLPAPCVRVFGSSPAARSLVAVGRAMGYATELVAPGVAGAAGWADRVVEDVAGEAARAPCREPLFAVVATMGEFDEEAVVAALAAQPFYLGVVASRRRFAELRESLIARGVSAHALDRIRNPAGLDVGARRPEELAVSIFAEIVQLRREATQAEKPAGARAHAPVATAPGGAIATAPGGAIATAPGASIATVPGASIATPPGAAIATPPGAATLPDPAPAVIRAVAALRPDRLIDPVCGMIVEMARARHVAELEGVTYAFCCARCRERFLAAPASFGAAAAKAGD
jgi:xanthine dehydrogenase accessory factor